jgi:hypothetical protein
MQRLAVSASIAVGLQLIQGEERLLGDCDVCKLALFFCWWMQNHQRDETIVNLIYSIQNYFTVMGARHFLFLLNEFYLEHRETEPMALHHIVTQLADRAVKYNRENFEECFKFIY